MKCPHAEIRFCPLYVAAHEGGGFGCDDGKAEDGRCAVGRGMDYGHQLARLTAAKPRLVAECAFAELEAERQAQRSLNLRLNGLH